MPRTEKTAYYVIMRFYAGNKLRTTVYVPLRRALSAKETRLIYMAEKGLNFCVSVGFSVVFDTTLSMEPRKRVDNTLPRRRRGR